MVAFTAQKMGYVGTCLKGYVGRVLKPLKPILVVLGVVLVVLELVLM